MWTTEIINPKSNVALKAAAGSGKTFNLSLRFVNLLLNGVEPERILCITFTNKATNEMYRRIIALVRYLAFELSPANIKDEARYILLARNANNEGDVPPDLLRYSFSDEDVDNLRKRAVTVYEKVVRNISRLRISTIDGFLNGILRLFPFEAGVMPDFRILTDRLGERLYMDAFDHFVRSLDEDGYLKGLVSRLIQASGKAVNSPRTFLYRYFDRLFETRVGVERIMRELLPCLDGSQDRRCIDDISDGLKRVGDMDISIRAKARNFGGLLRERCPEMSVRGINEITGYETSDAGSIARLTSMTKDMYNEYNYFKKCGHDGDIQRLFEGVKEEISRFVLYKNRVYKEAILYLFSGFTGHLDTVKELENGLTFSDVTNTCFRLLVNHGLLDKSPDYFYFRLDGGIDHLLVDEFQDTNFIQWLILKPFVDELTAGVGQKDRQGSFFYVGDPKQSIYRFRGGESRLFDKVLEQYVGKITPATLDTNFRSSREVVHFVNTVFTGIGNGYDFDYEMQECKREEAEGYVEVLFVDGSALKENPDVKKEKVRAWIKELTEKGYGPEDIAVLCGDNRECERYAEFLNANDIPAVTEGSLCFLGSPGVDAVIELLKYFHDTSQRTHLLNFLFSVPGLMTTRRMSTVLSIAKDDGVPDDIMDGIKKIHDRVNLLPVIGIITMIIDEFDLFARFGRDPNMTLLVETAASKELEDAVSLGVFLDFADTALHDIKAIQAESVHAVKSLTIHKAKGLEFPFVIVPELEKNMSVSARETQLIFEYDDALFIEDIFLNENEKTIRFHEELRSAVEREREMVVRDRLNQLYVAFTRARDGLFVVAVSGEGETAGEKTGASKPSDILCEVLGKEGRKAGRLPTVTSRRGVEPRGKVDGGGALDDVLDFVSCQRREPFAFQAREDAHETLSFRNFRDRRFGVAFHYAVRTLDEYSEEGIKTAILKTRGIYGSELRDEEIASIRKRLKLLFTDERFLELIGGMDLKKEVAFIAGSGVYIADLVAVGNETARVIDFKTGYEEDMIERYTKQVRVYRAVASKAFRVPCEGYLCFVLEDKIKYIMV